MSIDMSSYVYRIEPIFSYTMLREITGVCYYSVSYAHFTPYSLQ